MKGCRRGHNRAGRSVGAFLAALGIGLSLGVLAGDARAGEARRPNILVVLSDDHSAAHVGCYGNTDIKTPNLDKFAAEGIRFNRAYQAAPQCVPSRAAMMTGRSPVGIRMTRFSAPLPRNIPVYPELLRKQGYFSGVAGRSYHLDGSATPPETEQVFTQRGLRTFPDRLDFVKTAGNGNLAVTQFREFLEAVPAGRPWVLQLCFSDPHRPLDRNAIPQPHDPAKLKLPVFYPDTPGVRDDFARYYDEISRFDGHFGQVMAELDQRGLAKNTLVVFMGDNGASQFRGKGTLYEFGVRVPMLARWPGVIQAGRTSAELISGEDLAPTFLEIGGATLPAEITGKTFLPLLKGQPFAGRKHVFAERGAHGSGLPTQSAAFDLGRCVVSQRYKLIYNALWQIPYWPVDFAGESFWKDLQKQHEEKQLSAELERLYFSPTRQMFELYDLANDPNELTNLIGKPEAVTAEAELKAALQEWMILEQDYLPLPVPPGARPNRRAAMQK